MIDREKILHIVPLNDAEDHLQECEFPATGTPHCPCKCEPGYIEQGNSLLVVHGAFDGRLGVEWANEILSK